MITTKKINEYKIKLIPNIDKPKTLLNENLFSEPFPNILILAKKKSGKTTVIYNILDRLVDKNTIVIFFVSTLLKDSSYKQILKNLKSKCIPYIPETSFYDDFGNNQLNNLITYLKKETPDEETRDLNPFDSEDSSEDSSENPYMGKTNTILDDKVCDEHCDSCEKCFHPHILMVLDDLSAETRNDPALAKLLKTNRHLKITVIISTQEITDLKPDMLLQMQYCLAFSSIPKDSRNNKLRKLWSSLNLGISYLSFEKLYEKATAPDKPGEKSHNFLYIDVDNLAFRKNFNISITI